MHELKFWKSWAKVYQHIGLVIASAFFFSILYLWYAWSLSPGPVLEWMEIQEQELVQLPVHSFQQGLVELTVFGDSYLIFEKLLGDSLKPNPTAGYIFLGVLTLSMVMMLSLITTLTRFWYLLGMGLFILFIVGFRMEIIQMFDLTGKLFTIIVLSLYIIPSFYFQFFRTHLSFLARIITFSIITLVIGVAIVNFSGVLNPLLHLSVTGITSGIILSVIFILMVAHEFLASFVFITSQSTRQTKSLNHFLIISVIYMLNLALAYAHKIGSIDWDFMYINFYLLLTVSGILGVWGFRQREPQYIGIIQADPFGVYFFLSLGAICFATVGYFIGTSNDSALVTINDAIIYGHLGYGIIFLTYILSNFIAMMAKNLPVYKVLYKPNNMPYFTFRFGGLIATLAFVFYNTWQVPVQNAFSAYHVAAGDLYNTQGNPQFAEAFYQQAGVYGFLNHHSNYAIANIEGRKFNSIKERNFYNRASQRRPTEFSMINYSQTFEREGNWLEAMLAMQEAQNKFPTSGPILNNLGLIYARLNIPDSALYFFQQAMNQSITREAAQTNFIGVAANNNFNVSADSLLKLLATDNPGTASNALAFANLQKTKIEMDLDLKSDTVLNLYSASLINNYLLNHLKDIDTTLITQVIELAKKPVNKDYREAVLYSSSLACYAVGQIGRAFSLMEEVAILSNDQSKYNTILTLWALEQNAPLKAQRFASYILNQSNRKADPVVAITLSESGRLGEALVEWDSLRRNMDTTYQRLAQKMINALAGQANLVNKFSDDEKFLYAKYRIPITDTVAFLRIVNSLNSDDLKARAILLRSQQLFEYDDLKSAVAIFQHIQGLQLVDRELFDQINHFELDLLAKQSNLDVLANQINNSGINFSSEWKSQQLYFNALLSDINGDSVASSKLYKWLAEANPFDEEATISAARYLSARSNNNLIAYNIITDALYANPYSVKLLKAYSIEAASLNFQDYTNSALERLRSQISTQAFTEFLLEHQETFEGVLQ